MSKSLMVSSLLWCMVPFSRSQEKERKKKTKQNPQPPPQNNNKKKGMMELTADIKSLFYFIIMTHQYLKIQFQDSHFIISTLFSSYIPKCSSSEAEGMIMHFLRACV